MQRYTPANISYSVQNVPHMMSNVHTIQLTAKTMNVHS